MDNFQYKKNVIEISDTIPLFVTDNYPKFVEFINTYFEFLESSGNYLDILENFNTNLDIDFAEENYLNKLALELGFYNISDIKEIFLNKKIFIRFISDFNKSRGTANSFKLLWRLFFNLTCEIKYPKDQLFYTNSSNFIKKHYLIVSTDNIKDFVSPYTTKAFSSNYIESELRFFSNASQLDALEYFFHNNILYARLEIIQPKTNYKFNEKIYLTIDGIEYRETVQNIINFNIINPGYNYKENDKITLSSSIGTAIVSKVSTGSLETVEIINPGINYKVGDTIELYKSPFYIGYGFIAVVSEVSIEGNIKKIIISNNGYGYTKSEFLSNDIFIKTEAGTNAQLKISSTQIGKIQEIKIVDEFINASDSETITIETVNGIDAELEIELKTNHNAKGFKRKNINVLGSGLILQNSSNHLHSKSYTISSEIGFNFTDNLVKDYLHPTGLFRHYEFLVKELITDDNNLYLSPSYVIKVINILSQLNYYDLETIFKLIKIIYDNIGYSWLEDRIDNLEFYKFSENFKFDISRYKTLTFDNIFNKDYFVDGLDAQIKFYPLSKIVIEMPIINIKILNRIDNVSFEENRHHFDFKNVIDNYSNKSDVIYNNLSNLSTSIFKNYNDYSIITWNSGILSFLTSIISNSILLNDDGYFTDALNAEMIITQDGNVLPLATFILW